MAIFKLRISTESKFKLRASSVTKLIQKALGKKGEVDECDRVKMNLSRAERLGDAVAMITDAQQEIESLKEELEEWQSNLPEQFQQGDKNDELQEAIDALDAYLSDLNSLGEPEVNFPGMY